MRIKITKSARKDLSQIVDYYAGNGIRLKGRKVRAEIIDKIMELQSFPNLGKVDDKLSEKYECACRVLVFKVYKILYYIEEEEIVVMVLKVFDTRQNPDKL